MKLSQSILEWVDLAKDEARETEITAANVAAATEGLEKLLEQSDNVKPMTTGEQQ